MAAPIWEDIKMRYERGSIIIKLIMANVGVHIFLALLYVPVFLILGAEYLQPTGSGSDLYWQFIENWFYFPSELKQIPFRFWTIFSYMFLHDGTWHILSNMLVLYYFGEKVNDLIPSKKIFPLYIWGGVVGALTFTIGFNIFPAFSNYSGNLVGASASVMAIVLAAATLNPRGIFRPFGLFNIELQYIALIWVIFNLIVIPGGNPGGALAHLGGAFMGWFYIHQLRKGVDLAAPINKVIDFVLRRKNAPNVTRQPKQKQQTENAFKAKMNIYKGSQRSDYYGNEYGRPFMQKYKDMSKEECLNTILDKIKRTGYDGLTEDEKVFLDRYRDYN